jgi:hypothetical protein
MNVRSAAGSWGLLLSWVIVLTPGTARAQGPSLPKDQGLGDEQENVEEATLPAPVAPSPADQQIAELQDSVARLRQELSQSNELSLQKMPVIFSGYIDIGFFSVTGGGEGIIEDYGHERAPNLSQFGWVFLGDLLSTQVNSRGEVADLGEFPGLDRFDSIDSDGAPGFILNEVNLGLAIGISDRVRVSSSLNFVPRTGANFALGDFFDLDLAQLEWIVWQEQPTSIFVGKIEPAFGIEYKQRKASQRFGITPSLMHRYTSGSPLGVKVRSKLFDEWLIVALAATNGSSMTEQFHFYDEVDSNYGKTGSGRVAVGLPVDRLSESFTSRLEIGVSGEFGPQDRTASNAGAMWLVGADIEYLGEALSIRGQVMMGRAPGDEVDNTFSLDLNLGGYFEIDYAVLPFLGVIGRAEMRDALVTLGTERAYLTKSWRAVVGVRASYTEHLALKAELVHNGEYGEVPEFANDVLTTSLVLAY